MLALLTFTLFRLSESGMAQEVNEALIISWSGELIQMKELVSKFEYVGVISENCSICLKQIREIKLQCPEVLNSIGWLGLGDIKKMKNQFRKYGISTLESVYLSNSEELKAIYSQTPSFIFKGSQMQRGYQSCQQLLKKK
jgi:hypothetical protein